MRDDVNGRIMSPLHDYAVERLGDGARDLFAQAVTGAGVAPAHAMDPHGWVPLEVFHAVVDALRPEIGDGFVADALGWAVPRRRDFSAVSLTALARPAFVYRHFDRARSFFARHLTFQVNMISGEEAELSMTYRGDVPRRRDSCDVARGVLRSVPLLFDLPPAEVHELGDCWAAGATACRYRVRWRREPPFALAGIGTGAVAGVLGALAAPSLVWLAAPVAGFLAGRELRSIGLRRTMTLVTEDQRRVLEENERAFQKRFDQIRELNEDLEQRVAERTATLRHAMEELRQQNQSLRYSIGRVDAMQSDVVSAGMQALVGQRVQELAHEIRNPMTYVLSNLSFLEEAASGETPELDELTGAAKDVRAGVERMQAVLAWFLELHREGSTRRSFYDITAEIERTVELFRQELGGRIEVKAELEPQAPFEAFGQQLTQVLVNLLSNASHAMRTGTIRVRAWRRDGHAGFSVEDDGPGIPAEVRSKLFQRGVTTKPPGRGSGLGLFISRAIVERHGGQIRIEGAPGSGTTAIVEIPVRSN